MKGFFFTFEVDIDRRGCHGILMQSLGVVLPQGACHTRQILSGIWSAAEHLRAWQVVELQFFTKDATGPRDGFETLDGLISWVDRGCEWVAALAAKGIPVVNCGGGWQDVPGVATIAVEMDSVLDLAIRHFVDLQIRRIFFFGHRIASSPLHQDLIERLKQRASRLGVEVGFVESGGTRVEADPARLLHPEAEHDLIARLSVLPHGVGLLCESDHLGRLACTVARHAGLRIPTDLAVLGVGDNEIARFGEPSISSVQFPGEEIGRRAFRMIVEACAGGSLPETKVSIAATKLIVRESTGGIGHNVELERINRRIEMEAPTGLTFGDLVADSGMSPKVLRCKYQAVYGEKPSAHIQRLRLVKAATLLRDTEMPIGEVAAGCGFAGQSAFNNYVVRHLGFKPGDVRTRRDVE
jgi:LacI family transcriptional regulator